MGIKEEILEIYEEMKEDYKKGKEYAYQYRKTIFWIFVTFIVMQFTDILSLGASWQSMCQENPNLQLKKVQKGGEGEGEGKTMEKTPDKISAENQAKINAKFEQSKADATAKLEADKSKALETQKIQEAEKAGFEEGKKTKEDERKAKAEAKAAKAGSKSGKGTFQSFRGFRDLGPMSGFLSKIGKFIKGGFFIVGMIIAILIVSFIPFLAFCTVMYYIIRYLSRKFVAL